MFLPEAHLLPGEFYVTGFSIGQKCSFFMGQMLKSSGKHAPAILQGLTGLYMDKKIPVERLMQV